MHNRCGTSISINMKSIPTKTFWILWTMISLLLIGTLITDIEITNGLIKKGLIYIFIFGLVKITTAKVPWELTRRLVVSTVVFGLFLILYYYSYPPGDWKTQTIIYKNNHLANRTIEFQLQGKGALGYNRRTVDRLKLFPFVSWTKELTEENLKIIDSLTAGKSQSLHNAYKNENRSSLRFKRF
jgi:hypothetical protein